MKQVRAWTRFQQYTTSIGLQSDPYLDNFSPSQRTRFLSALAHAIQEDRFCDAKHHKTVKSDSVHSTLDCISQVFNLAHRPDPRLGGDGKFTLLLQQQLRGYNSLDTPTRPQVAMTASILHQFYSIALSSFDKALCKLVIGAFFFTMCSCEYIQVTGPRKTKLLTVKNINFYKGKKLLHHKDPSLR